MKKRDYVLVICIIMSILLIISCGNSKLTELKTTVKEAAKKLNSEFAKISDTNKELQKKLEDAYSKTDLNTIDISKMDVKDGGKFYLFQDKMYTQKFDAAIDECSVYFTGATPLNDTIKKEMLLIKSTLCDLANEKKKNNLFIGRISITAVDNYQLTYPGGDPTAGIPVGLDFTKLPIIQKAMNSQVSTYWHTPTISMGVEGIIIGHYAVVKVNGNFKLASIVGTLLPKLIYSVIGDIKDKIFIAYPDQTVFGSTSAVKDAFNIKSIEVFDYTQQLKDNPKMGEEFKLSYEKNSDEIKALGALLTNDNVGKDLTITINKKKYNVVIETLPENNFFVVGLI